MYCHEVLWLNWKKVFYNERENLYQIKNGCTGRKGCVSDSEEAVGSGVSPLTDRHISSSSRFIGLQNAPDHPVGPVDALVYDCDAKGMDICAEVNDHPTIVTREIRWFNFVDVAIAPVDTVSCEKERISGKL